MFKKIWKLIKQLIKRISRLIVNIFKNPLEFKQDIQEIKDKAIELWTEIKDIFKYL